MVRCDVRVEDIEMLTKQTFLSPVDRAGCY